jgi:hypothetical protein
LNRLDITKKILLLHLEQSLWQSNLSFIGVSSEKVEVMENQSWYFNQSPFMLTWGD